MDGPDISKALTITTESWIRGVLSRRWCTVAQATTEVRSLAGPKVCEEHVIAEIKALRDTPPPNKRLCSFGSGHREIFRLYRTDDESPEFVHVVALVTEKLAELRRLCRKHVNCPASEVRKIAEALERLIIQAFE
jgi:hypothetical protein